MARQAISPDGRSATAPATRPRSARTTDEARLVRLAAPSLGGVVKTVLTVAACAIFLYLTWRVRVVIRLVGISLFFALALMPVVDALDNRVPGPRALIILTVYVILISSVALIGYLVGPSLAKQVQQIAHDAPRFAADLRHNGTFRQYDNRYHITPKLVRDAHRLPRCSDT